MHVPLPLALKVEGDFACFTRPETKVERVSYDVMTPSAARNILQAIFWKPQFDWIVQEIHVLKPIRRMSILRNEVTSRVTPATVRRKAAQGEEERFVVEDDRTQRHALILRDVAYTIVADVRLRPDAGPDANVHKYREQFYRRARSGQCAWTPWLGCREFSASFGLPEEDDAPIDETNALGRMLFDLTYDDALEAAPAPKRGAPPQASLFGEADAAQTAPPPAFGRAFGEGRPMFFNARLERGVLRVPTELYDTTLQHKRSR